MSSTNRSNARDFHVADYYVTPAKPIIEFLQEFQIYEPLEKDIDILDPTAGGDTNHPMSYPEALKELGFNHIKTVDIREDSLAEIKQDYLTLEINNKPDLIITNPPFVIAKEIIEKSLEDVKDGGWVIMLLRLNYFEGKARKEFWDKNMPKYAFVHRKRIAFTDKGGTDSIAYMHCCWQKGYKPEFVNLGIYKIAFD